VYAAFSPIIRTAANTRMVRLSSARTRTLRQIDCQWVPKNSFVYNRGGTHRKPTEELHDLMTPPRGVAWRCLCELLLDRVSNDEIAWPKGPASTDNDPRQKPGPPFSRFFARTALGWTSHPWIFEVLLRHGMQISSSEHGAKQDPRVASLWSRFELENASRSAESTTTKVVRGIADKHIVYRNEKRRQAALANQSPTSLPYHPRCH